jgi:hypothetical protein
MEDKFKPDIDEGAGRSGISTVAGTGNWIAADRFPGFLSDRKIRCREDYFSPTIGL